MAAETSGAQILMLRENFVATSTSRGNTADFAGTSNTSSNVSPSFETLSLMKDILYHFNDTKVVK
jgi:hypothetical protein